MLLGLLLLFVLTEAYGWIFSGLVVPGYLASVFIIQPTAGLVMVVEAVISYVLARLLSDHLGAWSPWNRFFGRERFFLILLVSVAVRLVSEGWALPELAHWLQRQGLAGPGLGSDLFSVGLIIVPLAANMLWKTGLARGLPQATLPTLAVYALLRFALIPYTNLSISDFELSYENIALGFLASPKTYIILLLAAYLAARMNIRYGWDSSGIVVLALLSLAWLSPFKVLTTVIEVLLLVLVSQQVLKLPVLKTANLEGARRIVLVFSVGYLLKFTGAWVLAEELPGIRATDYFGFGYLLPSLLALKILQKGNAATILLPALQTSLLALLLATVFGFGLVWIDPRGAEPWLEGVERATAPADRLLYDEAVGALGRVLSEPNERTERTEGRWLRLVSDLLFERRESSGALRSRAADLGLWLTLRQRGQGQGDLLLLSEADGPVGELAGLGLVVTRLDAASGLVVEVPHPVTEPGTAEAGALLFEELQAAALVISGVDAPTDPDRSLNSRAPPLVRLRRLLDRRPVLEVRAQGAGGNRLWATSQVPHALDLRSLRASAGDTELVFGEPPQDPLLPRHRARGRLQLSFGDSGLRSLLGRDPDADPSAPRGARIDGGLLALADGDELFPTVSQARWRSPHETELLALERGVLRPLIEDRRDVVADPDRLAHLDRAAGALGYELRRLTFGTGEQALLLREQCPQRLGWGWVLVRPEAETARFIALPAPFSERHTVPLALHLLRELDATLLVGASVRRDAAPSRAADPVAPGNLLSLFSVVHRVAWRDLERAGTPLGLQVRGAGADEPLGAPALLSPGVVVGVGERELPQLSGLAARLRHLGLGVELVDGSLSRAPFRSHWVPQVQISRVLDGLPYGVLWVGDRVRARFSRRRRAAVQKVLRAVSLQADGSWLREPWPADAVLRIPPVGRLAEELGSRWEGLAEPVERLIETGDLRYLGDLVERTRALGGAARWVEDRRSGDPLVVLGLGGQELWLAPLVDTDSGATEADDALGALRVGQAPVVLVGRP